MDWKNLMNRKCYQIKNAYSLLKNPKKYRGHPVITLRSGLEISWVFKFLDIHPSVLEWSSESIVVPYVSPDDGRLHRYFIDFWMKVKDATGDEAQYLIEIKPRSQCKVPNVQKRKTKKYLNEVTTYLKNQAKWNAATKFANQRGMVFKVITENEIPGT